jgi:hypothetical protein
MQGFEHEITQAMSDAYAAACGLLGLTECDHRARDVVARKIIALAQQGETDWTRLYKGVMTQCGLRESGCAGFEHAGSAQIKFGPPH